MLKIKRFRIKICAKSAFWKHPETLQINIYSDGKMICKNITCTYLKIL